MTVQFIRVALNGPFQYGLDYLVPPDHPPLSSEDIGKRVEVPLGRRSETGVIVALPKTTNVPWSKLKAFIKRIDERPVLTKEQLDLLYFMRDYYHASLGEACMTMLPNLLAQGKPLNKARKKTALKKQKNKDTESALTLNKAQQDAYQRIIQSLGHFQVFLLEGVTGSGKTEIYLQAAEKVLAAGGQVLVLVPEIGLTPQTLTRFQKRFKARIETYHSGMTDAQRRELWNAALKNEVDLVIGTRSAVFLPLSRLQLIIIDEEHDLSFKQQSGVYYSAKSLGLKRAQSYNIPIILGSATPSLESIQNALEGRYQHLQLPIRAGSSAPVRYHVIDMRGGPKRTQLSERLLEAMEQHLKRGEQVLIFLNRRGYAPILLCNQCGFHCECQDCNLSFTLHQYPRLLMCHHCGLAKPIPHHCPQCQGKDSLVTLGLGTEQVEHQLKERFPDYPLQRIDQDATRLKGSLEGFLEGISQGKTKIIVGTQMLAKGHHFAHITMVGIVDVDYGLFAPDFRALERMGQLLLQVAGRAGREEKEGHVYLQTHQPEHPSLQSLLREGYAPFARSVLEERKVSHWPPFSYLALLRVEGKQESDVLQFLKTQKEMLIPKTSEGVQILGPVPAFMPKKAGRYRAQLLFQSNQRKTLHQLLLHLESQLAKAPPRQLRWSIDVDPLELG